MTAEKEFSPPIAGRMTEDLLCIVYGGTEEFHPDAIRQAERELDRRKEQGEDIDSMLRDNAAVAEESEAAWEKQKKLNADESYTRWEMLAILFLGWMILLRGNFYKESVSELRRANYLKKAGQRTILLALSAPAWIMVEYVMRTIVKYFRG